MADKKEKNEGDIRDSDAVVVDDEGRPRFRTLRVNAGDADEDSNED